MDLKENLNNRSRLARTALAAALAAVAASSLLKGKRLRGALAAVGALAVGYGATQSGELAETIDIGMGEEEDQRSQRECAACGQPIVPGQRRGPNESGEIVHEDCK